MTDDIDNMTETQIDSKIRYLEELRRRGQMTLSHAWQLARLQAASRMIRSTSRSRYWP